MSSYHQSTSGGGGGGGAYQQVPSIYNDHQTDNIYESNDNTTASATSSSSFPSMSTTSPMGSHASFLSNHRTPGPYEPRDELGKRNLFYICAMVFLFLFIEGVSHHSAKKLKTAVVIVPTENSNVTLDADVVNVVTTTTTESAKEKKKEKKEEQEKEETEQEEQEEEEQDQEEVAEKTPPASSSSTGGLSLAYLLSYPRSGTTYTVDLIASLAQTKKSQYNAVASNYASTCAKDDNGDIYPVFTDGPCYVSNPYPDNNVDQAGMGEEEKETTNLRGAADDDIVAEEEEEEEEEGPSELVVTVTHCGGRCPHASINCHPQDYIETYESFEQACRTTSSTSTSFLPSSTFTTTESDDKEEDSNQKQAAKDEDDDGFEGDTTQSSSSNIYPSNKVTKGIHLYRNPFNNIVSQYHAAYAEHKLEQTSSSSSSNSETKTHKAWLKTHANNKAGFVSWCHDEMDHDEDILHEEALSKFITLEIMVKLKNVPCHAEFYRYVQFHNLVSEVLEFRELDSIVVYYEEYGDDLMGVADRLSSFLEYDVNDDETGTTTVEEDVLPSFVYGNTYEDYFTKEQTYAIWDLIESMAHPTVWKNMKYYLSSGD